MVEGESDRTERYVHTPGAANDAGGIEVIQGTGGGDGHLLSIHYENLGADGDVTVDGNGGTDTLVAMGTSASDDFTVDFTGTDDVDIDLVNTAGTHVDLLTDDVDNYLVESA